MNDEPLNDDGRGTDDELRVCRGFGKRSAPLELAFASTSAASLVMMMGRIAETGQPRHHGYPNIFEHKTPKRTA
jgi:hypothetical protein